MKKTPIFWMLDAEMENILHFYIIRGYKNTYGVDLFDEIAGKGKN